jgi:hypothetical protein
VGLRAVLAQAADVKLTGRFAVQSRATWSSRTIPVRSAEQKAPNDPK